MLWARACPSVVLTTCLQYALYRSPSAGELSAGALVDVIATAVLPSTGVVRVKFAQSGGLIGWCSMATAAGDVLLEPIGDDAQVTVATNSTTKNNRSSTGAIVALTANDGNESNRGQSNGIKRKARRLESATPTMRSQRPLKSAAELRSMKPFPTSDFLVALAAAEEASGHHKEHLSKTTQPVQKLRDHNSTTQPKELRALLYNRLEGIFAKCVLPDGSPDDHIASDRAVDTQRSAMAASLVACMSAEQIAEMIENTERSHMEEATAKARREARRQRRHSMDAAIAV